MLDEGDKDILRVVLFEGDVGVWEALGLLPLGSRRVLWIVLIMLELWTQCCEVSHYVHAVT